MTDQINGWPSGISGHDFPIYQPRRMGFIDHWHFDEWTIKAYGIQHRTLSEGEPVVKGDIVASARKQVSGLLPLTKKEGEFYKTGFAVLHEGDMANWLLFQWWTHHDIWCQFVSYSHSDTPLTFKRSTGPVRACVYETAIIWFEQKSWIRNVLNGNADRRAYLLDVMQDDIC